MKILWLLSLMYSLILASQTQIVVGSYSNVKNATRAQKELKDIIKKDPKFQSFYNKHSLTIKHQVYGKYFRVVVEPFNDSIIQSEALKKFRLIFKNAYVLSIKKEVKLIVKKPVAKKHVIKKPIVKKSIIKKTVTIKPVLDETLDEQKDEIVVEIEMPKKIISKKASTKEVVIDTPAMLNELDGAAVENKQDKENTNYLIIFSVLFIIIVLVVYFLLRKTRHKKRELIHPIKENEEEYSDIFQKMVDVHHIQKIEEEQRIKNEDKSVDTSSQEDELDNNADNSSKQDNILQKMMEAQNKKRAEKGSTFNETGEESLVVMQNITETINFDALDKEEEADDEIEILEKTRRKNKARVYRRWQSTKAQTKEDD